MYVGLVCVVLLAVFLLILENYRETHRFILKKYTVSSHKLFKSMKPKTVIVLSDLHNKVYGKDNQELFHAIEIQKPDMILIAGDMLVGHTKHSFQGTAEFVGKLAKLCPVYYGNGNHEQRMKECVSVYGDRYQRYVSLLQSAGVIVLENESVTLDWDGVQVSICGLEIPMDYYKKFQRHFLSLEEMKERVGTSITKGYQILIAHNPVHYQAYQQWGADLVVSGHLHGGIIRLPFIGGIITPQVQLFPVRSGGIYQSDQRTHVVSKGLGDHTVRIRLFNPAEVVVVQVKGTK